MNSFTLQMGPVSVVFQYDPSRPDEVEVVMKLYGNAMGNQTVPKTSLVELLTWFKSIGWTS